jgi:hypothetical protein
MIKYERRIASGALGSGLDPTAKYLRRTKNGAADNGLSITIKYLWQTTNAGYRLATSVKYQRGTTFIGLGTATNCRAQCLCVEPELLTCVQKQKLTPEYVPIRFGDSKNHISKNATQKVIYLKI